MSLVQGLLKKGANPLFADEEGLTALMRAAWGEDTEKIKMLLPLSDPLASNEQGQTALMLSARRGHRSAIEALLPHSDARARDISGQDALMHACAQGSVPAIEALIPVSEIGAVDAEGSSASLFLNRYAALHRSRGGAQDALALSARLASMEEAARLHAELPEGRVATKIKKLRV